MPLCSRCALVGAVLALLVFAGCDSTAPNRLDQVDGVYTVSELRFDPSAAALADVDVTARLNTTSTGLEIFGGDGSALLRIRFLDAGTSRRADLQAMASRGWVTLTAETPEDEDDLRTLFLPPSFSLTYDQESPRTLSGTLSLRDVDLQGYDPDQYQGLTAVSGTLYVRLERE